ncbi:MAG: choline dehydrogenase, partial [Alphaproteobacteria bacterium]|nr:choline dehydrogenase [Alphaproteobacteria bacterium]
MLGFDFIIVGAGTAGCVLANRLSADPTARVLLLESGPPDRHWHVTMPMGNIEALKGTRFNWSFMTEPEPHLGGRRLFCPRGRALGGSSSINGMVHVRGHPKDFDRWVALGGTGWGFHDVLPYFRKSERYLGPPSPWRGTDGPLTVTKGRPRGPLDEAFLAAADELGLPSAKDFNGPDQEGFGPYDLTIHQGRRVNGACAYLHPVRTRPNLKVWTGAHVMSVRMAHHRAAGVDVVRDGRVETVAAEREVILAAGAVQTPQILMLSGIGPAEELKANDVEVRHALAGVGDGLQNHIDVYMKYRSSRPVSLNAAAWPLGRALAGSRWFLNHSGVCASNGFETGGFFRAQEDSTYPDAQIIFFPVAFKTGSFEVEPWHGFQFHVGTQKPVSRGWVRLASADPTIAPRLRYNYLATERDRDHIRNAMRRVRDLVRTRAFAPFLAAEVNPTRDVESDADLDAWLRA